MSLAGVKEVTEIFSPVTGEKIGESEQHDIEYLQSSIAVAKKAQPEWEKLSPKERAKKVIKIRDYLVNNLDELAETISKDNGKVRVDALAAELVPAAMATGYYCKNANKWLKEKSAGTGNIMLANKRSILRHVPFGVIGIISPWNYPFAIPYSEVIMGLLAGNAVILKTASETQLTGLALKKAVEHAGLPEGIFTYINMPGKIAGDAFLENGIGKLFFTGSVPVGKILMKKASETLTPVVLELGGNDAMIVCSDADPYRAAAGALWGGFQNSGQSCGGVERVYVHEDIYESFMEELKKKVTSLRVGPEEDFESDMGCMTTARQAGTVKDHITDALEKGAEIFAKSGAPDNSGYLPAVVLTNVTHEMKVMLEETFGPVIGVMKVKSEEDAIELANDSNLGLTASVWTKNNRKGKEIARRIKAGAVTINDHLMSHGLAETPWGGFKESGIGRTHGKSGFLEMTELQVIVKDILPFVKKNMWWHPYSKKLYDGLKGLVEFLYAGKFSTRLRGLTKLVNIVPRMFGR